MNEILLDLGSDGISLNFGKKKTTDKEIKELAQTLQVLADLERALFEKGVLLREYLDKRDKKNGFPLHAVDVTEGAAREYFFDEEEVEKFVKKFEKKETAEGAEGEEVAKEEILPYEIVPILEGKELEKIDKKLEKWGFSVASFFENEELFYELDCGGKNIFRVHSLREILEKIKANGKEGMTVQRYKGLGEMNPEQLWETTMNPETRTLLQVQLEDAMAADEMFTVLMGDEVAPRRKFIERNARMVRNLDI